MMRAEGEFEIINQLGLHARAATKLVRLAGSFRATVRVEKDGQSADAKSVMGVLLLCGQKGSRVRITAEGDDAQAAVAALGELIGGRFGEPK